MRVSSIAMALVLLGGCAESTSHAPKAQEHPLMATAAAETEVMLTEGQELDGPLGLHLSQLGGIMDAHLANSENAFLVNLTVTRDGKSERIGLDRRTSQPPKFYPHLGLQLALVEVDAYHQPGWAKILVKP